MSRVRIIAGEFRRRRIDVPDSSEVRPTSDRVREAVFSVIDSRLEYAGDDVLDLYAGSGALGFEALSRGAGSVMFVDRDANSIACCRRNAQTLGVSDRCRFVKQDATSFLRRGISDRFRLILADPPYAQADVKLLPGLALALLDAPGLFVLESDGRLDWSEHANFDAKRSYGRTSVFVFATGEEHD